MATLTMYQEEVHELIRLFLSFPPRYSELVEWAESERNQLDCNWTRIRDLWTQEFKTHPRPLEGSNYVEGMGRVYKGAAYYQEKSWTKALKHFGLADQAFAYDNDSFRLALTCMAKGLCYRASDSRAEAHDHFKESQEAFESLSHHFWILRERVHADQCKALSGKLKDLTSEMTPGGYYRPRVHLAPVACEGFSDIQLWFGATQLTTEMVMLGKQYRLLSLGSRSVQPFRFGALEDYFVINSQDHCMINAGIHSGDNLLVRRTDAHVEGGVLVVRVDERDGTHPNHIRRMHYDGEFLILEPANSKCPTRTFRASAAVVSILGEVVAVLEPVAA